MNWRKFAASSLLIVGVALAGCAKKQEVRPDEAVSGGEVTDSAIESGTATSDSGNAMGLQTIHFPFDSFEIVGENRDILRENIQILKENPTVAVQIEGHCDERGGIQYNLALGEKRANAVKNQMMAAGIAGSRITTISMGKEKPLEMGSGEDVWAKNRRANFVITSK